MATLKSLVDETTNIKDEIVECRDNLRQTLIEKGVECNSQDKMSNLIGKIDNLKISYFPNWYKTRELYLPIGEFSDLAFSYSSSVIIDNLIYVRVNNKLVVYNADTNQIVESISIPYTETTSTPISVVDHVIYFIGANKANGNKKCFKFNIKTKVFSLISEYDGRGRTGPVLISVGKDIYIYGGIDWANGTTYSRCYNTLTDTYTTKPTIPSTVCDTDGYLYNNKLYIPAYYAGYFEVFDINTQAWLTRTSSNTQANTQTYLGGLCGNSDKIYIMGGRNNLKESCVYDISKDEWLRLEDMPIGREGLSLEFYNNNIYILCGTGTNLKNYCYVI